MTKSETLALLENLLKTLNREQLNIIYHVALGLRVGAGEGRKIKTVRIGK